MSFGSISNKNSLNKISQPNFISPSSLFQNGEQGAWYDPSDMSTLFQDAAGTTPVTAVEQPVSLMLDKSKGLALGSELVTNGDFSNGTTAWTAGGTTTQSVVDGYLRVVAGDIFGSYQVVTTNAGKWYEVRGQIAMISGGTNVRIRAESGTIPGGTPLASSSAVTSTTPTDVVFIFLATASSHAIYLRAETTGSVGRFDNISVKEIAGNHAYTPSTATASRPVLSARVNVLTRTENFSDAVWTKTGVTVEDGTLDTTDPLGTNTATKLIETATTGGHRVAIVTGWGNQTQWRVSCYFKKGTRRYAYLGYDKSEGQSQFFDLDTGTVAGIASAGGVGSKLSAGMIDVGDGWYYCYYDFDLPVFGGGSRFFWFGFSTSVGFSYTGTTDNFGYVWGPDGRRLQEYNLTFTEKLPRYQKVVTTTDYNTTGFPMYLRFDGSDDYMLTNSIDFTNTSRLSIWSAAKPFSQAQGAEISTRVLAELSATLSTNNGTFTIFQPTNASTNRVDFKGTTARSVIDSTPTPLIFYSTVNFAYCDLSTPTINLKINKNDIQTSNSSLGTGSFGNYPMYIGRRGGTTLAFSGRLYSLIIVANQINANNIANISDWVNTKTLAY